MALILFYSSLCSDVFVDNPFIISSLNNPVCICHLFSVGGKNRLNLEDNSCPWSLLKVSMSTWHII